VGVWIAETSPGRRCLGVVEQKQISRSGMAKWSLIAIVRLRYSSCPRPIPVLYRKPALGDEGPKFICIWYGGGGRVHVVR
jgi:hypothetical protein